MTLCPSLQLFDGAEEFADMLDGLEGPTDAEDKSPDLTRHKVQLLKMNTMRTDDFLCDVTLLVGPDKVPMRAHRIVLAGFSEYFKGMFSAGTVESNRKEISLPFVDAESMQIILDYVYGGKVELDSLNVHKMAIAANFFGSECLVEECCTFLKKSINKENCSTMLQFSDQYNLSALKEAAKTFILDRFEEVAKSNLDFMKLPIPLLVDLVKHPKAVICDNNPAENEKQLFALLWNGVIWLEEAEQNRFLPEMLLAVRLPCVEPDYMSYIEKKVGHVSEATSLIQTARDLAHRTAEPYTKEQIKAVRPWCIGRCKNTATVNLRTSLASLQRERKLFSRMICMKGGTQTLFAVCADKEQVRVGFALKVKPGSKLVMQATYSIQKRGQEERLFTGKIGPQNCSNREISRLCHGYPLQLWRSQVAQDEIDIEATITVNDAT